MADQIGPRLGTLGREILRIGLELFGPQFGNYTNKGGLIEYDEKPRNQNGVFQNPA